jgi:hypothetical protein
MKARTDAKGGMSVKENLKVKKGVTSTSKDFEAKSTSRK